MPTSNNSPTPAFLALEQSVGATLETYSNVHRGSGHHALLTTRLYEQAKRIVLDHLGLDPKKYLVVFGSPRRAEKLIASLAEGRYRLLSSQDLGLPLGLRALAIERRALPKGIPAETGGGTARLVAGDYVIWANGADRFEPGTPPIVNAIALARALQLVQKFGPAAFHTTNTPPTPDQTAIIHDDFGGYSGKELLTRLRQSLVGLGAQVPTTDGARTYVNLDNAASTPTFQPIWETVRRAWRCAPADQAAIIEQSKAICAEAMGAPRGSFEVVFTANTTEAINLVAESLAKESVKESVEGIEPVILNTILEHNSNELPWRSLAGHALLRLPMDQEGFLDPAQFEKALREYNELHLYGRKRIRLVAVTGASNVLGSCLPLGELGRLAHRFGARLLVDAAQLAAHRAIDVENSGVDYLAFSGHKIYAPFGTGVLIARKGELAFTPAELQKLQASGEENVGGIAALAHALSLLRRIGFPLIQAEEQALTQLALRGLATLPAIRLHGMKDPSSPRFSLRGGVIILDGKGKIPGRMARALAEHHGIGVRSGCHCAHLTIKRVLGIPAWAERLQQLMLTLLPSLSLPGVLRISFGLQNTEAEVATLLAALAPPLRKIKSADMKVRLQEYQARACERVFGA